MTSNLPLLPKYLENALQRFSDKRQPESEARIKITRKRLYILPTRHGISFFLILLLILFGAINYQNSLGFMLAFLLGSLGLLGMIYTHQNINNLNIHIGRTESVFAGQEILFPLTISKSDALPHPSIQFLSESGQIINIHLLNENESSCKLPLTARHRGYVKPGRIKIYSEFPLGLFHAWSWLNLKGQCLVYPAPDSHHYPLQQTGIDATGTTGNNKTGVDDFAGIRQYQSGDSPNHMAWKAIAKTGELQTKLFNNESSNHISISWSQTLETLNTEQRLSILCRMVLDASEKSLKYGLNIPGTIIPPGSGLQHKHKCLKSLALFGLAR